MMRLKLQPKGQQRMRFVLLEIQLIQLTHPSTETTELKLSIGTY